MKRPVWLITGVALGVGGTLWAEQRVKKTIKRTLDRFTPESIGNGAIDSVRSLNERVKGAVNAALEEQSLQETLLRAEFDPGFMDDTRAWRVSSECEERINFNSNAATLHQGNRRHIRSFSRTRR